MSITFFGTSTFAIPILESLIKNSYNIIAVITVPDKPVGRKKIIAPPPIKSIAQKYKIPTYQPKNKEELIQIISKLNPDLGIVAAYGKLIPQEILNLPKYKIINIHPSLLPKYRGPTPIQTAILNGEKQTGVTIMILDKQLDHGDIISKIEYPISENDNYQTLYNKLSKIGAELLIKTLPDWIKGKIKSIPQNHQEATFTKKYNWDDGKIDWSRNAEEVIRKIKALNPEPGTWTTWNGKILKILDAKAGTKKTGDTIKSGLVYTDEKNIYVQTKSGSVLLKKIQLEGKKPIEPEQFILGNKDFIGANLGVRLLS